MVIMPGDGYRSCIRAAGQNANDPALVMVSTLIMSTMMVIDGQIGY